MWGVEGSLGRGNGKEIWKFHLKIFCYRSFCIDRKYSYPILEFGSGEIDLEHAHSQIKYIRLLSWNCNPWNFSFSFLKINSFSHNTSLLQLQFSFLLPTPKPLSPLVPDLLTLHSLFRKEQTSRRWCPNRTKQDAVRQYKSSHLTAEQGNPI